jgi:hypothetical protein
MYALSIGFAILGVLLVSALVVISFSGKKATVPISKSKDPWPMPDFSAHASSEPEPIQEIEGEEAECRCSAPGDACCAK